MNNAPSSLIYSRRLSIASKGKGSEASITIMSVLSVVLSAEVVLVNGIPPIFVIFWNVPSVMPMIVYINIFIAICFLNILLLKERE